MHLKSFIAGCFAIVALAGAGSAAAQNCVGFTDVLASSPFCPNVEWLKNRGVTTGCGAGTTYCPSDGVTRLQMAIFMNRLGTALTPVSLTPGTSAASAITLPGAATPLALCQTADYAVTGANQAYPRRAFVYGTTNVSAPTGAGVDVKAEVAMSTNGGASWTSLSNSDHYATLYSGATPGNHVAITPFGWNDIAVGQTVRFALLISRFAGTGNVTASCAVYATIGNRNAASTPLDP